MEVPVDTHRFGDVIRSLSSRRTTFAFLTSGLLAVLPLASISNDAEAKKRKKRKKKKKRCKGGTEKCGGACVAACPEERIRNPASCGCCFPNGTVIEADIPTSFCCSNLTDPGSGVRYCVGRGYGEFCAFDDQCESDTCSGGVCI